MFLFTLFVILRRIFGFHLWCECKMLNTIWSLKGGKKRSKSWLELFFTCIFFIGTVAEWRKFPCLGLMIKLLMPVLILWISFNFVICIKGVVVWLKSFNLLLTTMPSCGTIVLSLLKETLSSALRCISWFLRVRWFNRFWNRYLAVYFLYGPM